MYPCQMCDAVFEYEFERGEHTKQNHKEIPGKAYPCSLCGEFWTSVAARGYHMRMDHPKDDKGDVTWDAFFRQYMREKYRDLKPKGTTKHG